MLLYYVAKPSHGDLIYVVTAGYAKNWGVDMSSCLTVSLWMIGFVRTGFCALHRGGSKGGKYC